MKQSQVFTTDGASPNFKAICHRANTCVDRMFAHKLCSLHNNKLVETHLISDTSNLGLIGRLYSASLVLKTSGYFSRLTSAVHQFIDGCLQVQRGQPPFLDTSFEKEVIDFVISNSHEEKVTMENADPSTVKLQAAWHHLLDLVPCW